MLNQQCLQFIFEIITLLNKNVLQTRPFFHVKLDFLIFIMDDLLKSVDFDFHAFQNMLLRNLKIVNFSFILLGKQIFQLLKFLFVDVFNFKQLIS